jgi:hypothetical protein
MVGAANLLRVHRHGEAPQHAVMAMLSDREQEEQRSSTPIVLFLASGMWASVAEARGRPQARINCFCAL